MSDNPIYKASVGSDSKPCVNGPGFGFGYDAGTLWPNMRLSTTADAEAAARIANEAYRQGRESFRADLQRLLGTSR